MTTTVENTILNLGMWLGDPNSYTPEQLQELRCEDARLNLISLANYHWVTGALANSLQHSSVWPLLDHQLQDYLLELQTFFAERAQQIKQEAIFACQILQQANIEVIILKGGANLFNGVASPNSTRFMTDIDLLVPESQQQLARDTLTLHGYTSDNDEFAIEAKGHHHAPPLHREDGACNVELHRWVVKKSVSDVLSTNEVWQQAIPLELTTGLVVKQLSISHQAVLSIAHSELSHSCYTEKTIDFRQLLNLKQIIEHYKSHFNWHEVTEHFSRCNKQHVLYASLNSINTLFNCKVNIPEKNRRLAQQHFYQCVHKKKRNRLVFTLKNTIDGYSKESILVVYDETGKFPVLRGRVKHLARHLKMLIKPVYLKRYWQKIRS